MVKVHDAGTAEPTADEALDLDTAGPGEWLAYLREICERLWPPPAVITLEAASPRWPRPALAGGIRPRSSAAHEQDCEFLLIPGGNRPPLLVPADPRLAASAVRHHRAARSWAVRMTSKALTFGLARGFGGSVVRGRVRVHEPAGADTIASYLRVALSRDIQLSMYLGPPRANRKPVLQLLSPAGDPVGYAKVGINPLTQELVRAEHAALTRIGQSPLTEITVPPVLHHDQWRGQQVLVLGTLPVWLRRTPPAVGQLASAMAEVARVGGLRSGPLAGSGYAKRLTERLIGASDSPERTALLQALGTLMAQAGDAELTYGAWHGDWSPWNMASTRSGLLVWDWERFATGVPLGFDALHYWLQGEVRPGGREPRQVAAECVGRAAELIGPLGGGAAQPRLTATLYLAELAARYLVDRQDEAGARLGATGTWLIPAITAEAARASSGGPGERSRGLRRARNRAGD